MRTPVTIENAVERELRAYARRHGTNFQKALNDLLRRGLAVAENHLPAKPFAASPKKARLRAGLSYDNVSELLERVEGGQLPMILVDANLLFYAGRPFAQARRRARGGTRRRPRLNP